MKKIFITGGSSGLGEAIIRNLSKEYYIIVVARRMSLMKRKFKNLNNLEFYQLDLANINKVNFFLKKIIKKHKDINYVINNAGFFDKQGIKDITKYSLNYSFNLNTFAPLIIMKFFCEEMKKKGFGRIINITSGAAFNCSDKVSLYSASKAALNAFSLTAAKEYKKFNVCINLFSPGPIRTEMMPKAKLSPNIAIRGIRYLLEAGNKDFTGKFIWINSILPTAPNLKGIRWDKGLASKKFPKIS